MKIGINQTNLINSDFIHKAKDLRNQTIFSQNIIIDNDALCFVEFLEHNKLITNCLKITIRRNSDYTEIIRLINQISYEEVILVVNNRRFVGLKDTINAKWINSLFEINTLMLSNFTNENNIEYPMFTENIILKDSVGHYHFKDRVIYISNFEGSIDIQHGSMLMVDKNTTKLDIYCSGKFSIYFEDPRNVNVKNIRVLNGIIEKTNCSNFAIYNRRITKFKKIENMNFSDKRDIAEFYGCQFINCIFNGNQFVTNSLLLNCFYEDEKNFINCTFHHSKKIN